MIHQSLFPPLSFFGQLFLLSWQGKVEQEEKVLASMYLHTLQRTHQSQVDFGVCIALNAKGKSIGKGQASSS